MIAAGGEVSMARPLIGDDERDAVMRVLDSGGLAQGPEVAAFEQEFAALVGGRTCVAVNSGTAALHLALVAVGIGSGDEVIVPSFTFAATANAVRLAGAVPVFADIEPDTFCLSPAAAEAAVTDRTKAVMPVHLYGHPADMPAFRGLADRRALLLVEDAAQAHGAEIDGTPVGAWGDAAAFSFYPTKNMTTGEGGMVVFASEGSGAAAPPRVARLLRNQGMEQQYANEVVGYNLRMTDMAAALGRVQLRRLPEFNKARRANADRLRDAVPPGTGRWPQERPNATHVYHQFTIRDPRRDELQAHLAAVGVQSRVYYPTPVHHLPVYVTDDALPETDRAAREVLSLPVGPHLTDDDLARIVTALEAWQW